MSRMKQTEREEEAERRGAEAERQAVVAWLRAKMFKESIREAGEAYGMAADEIERGEHWGGQG